MAVMMVLLVGNCVKCTKAYVIQCSYTFYENVLIPSIVLIVAPCIFLRIY